MRAAGIESYDSMSPNRRPVLIGHSFLGDLEVLRRDNIQLEQRFDLIALMNTQSFVQDFMDDFKVENLSSGILKYDLRFSDISIKGKKAPDFQGSYM